MPAEPFEVRIASEILTDLKDRLGHTRWPEALPGDGWSTGADWHFMRRLAEFWRDGFDWRAQEERLNALPHFRARVDGFGIHYLHVRGRGPRPLPLVLTHGWPSSFVEMLKIVPFLTDPGAHGGDPRDAFDVVVPSLPGFGFSDRPQAGVTSTRIASLWARLMTEVLGYERFAAHGGDIGAGVTSRLGLGFPEHVLGIHVTAVVEPDLGPGSRALSPAECEYRSRVARWEEDEGAYGHLQRTRPLTLAYGLQDSPVGLAAWIIEKWRAWSDCGGDVERRFGFDELLTNVTLYWATGTIYTSTRQYYDSRFDPEPFRSGARVPVPAAVALTREEVDRAPREWAERTYDVQRWTDMPRGGHFLALEEPELLAADLREFFRRFR